MKHPDPDLHQTISFIKSFIRIIGYISLLVNIPTGISILVISEIIGVCEELV